MRSIRHFFLNESAPVGGQPQPVEYDDVVKATGIADGTVYEAYDVQWYSVGNGSFVGVAAEGDRGAEGIKAVAVDSQGEVYYEADGWKTEGGKSAPPELKASADALAAA